ncbi:hypothetical protein ACFSTD_16525 [Novosphingobium colocasiae]|uniref:Uncharacterized protein n=1 Tax=Novosphingobium colocasiae TaxID=1256513 RepID=A0A918UCY2_9SPHN|nr:hypothetical protein GCM10011614_06170 [Novosphingobium colocasiae]
MRVPDFKTIPVVEPLTQPRHFAQPSVRERRAQAVHRLQIGLFGLCAMLMIVALANVIMERARLAQVDDPIQDVVAVDEQPKKSAADPLADIGVVPASDPSPADGSTGGTSADKPAAAVQGAPRR